MENLLDFSFFSIFIKILMRVINLEMKITTTTDDDDDDGIELKSFFFLFLFQIA